MNEQEFAELAAGYALDALSPEDLAAFQTARAEHPEWQRLVMTDAATAAALAGGVAAVPPPADARATLLARIAVTPQEPAVVAEPVEAPVPPVGEPVEAPVEAAAPGGEPAPNTATIQAISRRNWTRGLLGLAASLILLVTLGFGAVSLGQYLNRPADVAALEQIENAPDAESATAEVTDGGTATAHWSPSLGKAVLVSQGLPSIARDQSFELWFVRGGEPVSAGTFDDAKHATVLLDGKMQAGDVIAVTVEQQGGSPDGQPTSDPIVTIPTA